MKEVACKVFEILIRAMEKKGVPPERMVDGLEVTMTQLRNKNERITWDEHNAIMRNVHRHFTDDDLTEIGRMHFRSPVLRFVFVVARLRFTPLGFYRWLNTPREGVGNQLFTCIVPSTRDISPTEIEVDLTVKDGYEVCPQFFTVAKGNFTEMPRLLGYPAAKVELTRLPRAGRFHIAIPKKTPFFTRLRRAITWPFTVRAAARELQEAHETLQQRYEQLEDARAKLARRQDILDAAYQLGHRVWAELDPAAIAAGVVRGLTEVGGVGGVRLRVTTTGAADVVEQAGAVGGDADALGLALTGHRAQGRLELWPGEGAAPEDIRTLLELVVPTVALAINNAHAYRELADYQKNLERTVDERTAELRTARDSLRATVSQLEQARDARERIFGNISHEIRTPLSLILLTVRDLEARAALDAGLHAGTTSIEASARKLLRLVDELLLLAAGEERSLRLVPEPTDVAALAHALAMSWRPATESNGIALTVDAVGEATALADPVSLERIITNLLSNAVKFTPAGGRIQLRVGHAEGKILVAVRDTGVGIDDDLMKRLFGRFEQGQAGITGRGGSGIGLSLVKELAQAQGGDVTVERIATGGTEFRVTLPATLDTPTAATLPRLRPGDFGLAAAPIASGDVLAPEGKTAPTILLAEDDPALAASIARLLAQDCTVVVALDGLAALELAGRHQPHLLVTDVEMPGMNGVELTRRFRDLPGNGLAPVVMLSALADLRDRITGLDAGAVDYVVKPFDPGELRARVRAQLEMRNLALRLHRAEKLAALGTLSAGLAHELRNPANGIVNAVGPLREILPPELVTGDAPVGQLLEVLGDCADQIASLSKQLLGFRRGGDLELRTVALGDVVHRAISLIQPALRGVEIREELATGLPIRCAPPLLVQVLTNLVENAAHAAGKGGWVEIASRAGEGRVVVEVADSGPGVPRELRERIFEPFFTTKAPGIGTGLGLPVARDIVHRHGGILEIRERADRPVFVIDLPNRAAREPS